MTKHSLKILALATIVTLSLAPTAHAADLGLLPAGSTGYTAASPGSGVTTTTDFTFSLSGDETLYSINAVGGYNTLAGLSFDLFQTIGSTTIQVGSIAAGTPLNGLPILYAREDYSALGLGAGNYELAVTETARGDLAGSASGNITISAVPIPGALPLFASALIAVGGFAARKRRALRVA